LDRLLALLVAGLLASSASAQVAGGFIEAKRRVADIRVEAAITDWLQGTPAPGVVIAVVQDSEILALQGHGVSDLRSNASMDPSETVVWAGELVRMFSAAALLQLLDESRIDFDNDVNTYIKGLRVEPAQLPPVSVNNLLTETSGIDEIITGTMARHQSDLWPLGDYLRKRLPPRVRPAGRVSIPSSHGFSLAGFLVEEISKQGFSSYLQDHLLGPAGMEHTAVRATVDLANRAATGYRISSGALQPQRLDYPQNGPASSLWTTADDIGRWMRFLLAGGRFDSIRLLEPSSAGLILNEQFRNHPNLPGRSFGMVSRSRGDMTTLSRRAISNGFSTSLLLVPSHNLGIFISCNAEVDLEAIVGEVLGLLVGSARDASPTTPGVDSEVSTRLRGWYRDSTHSHSSPEKLLSLFQQERVRIGEGGSLIWRQYELRPNGILGFETDPGGAPVAFLTPTGRSTYLATEDEVLERLGWYEWWPVQACLWWFFASSFFATAWTRVHLAPAHAGLSADGRSAPRWPFLLARIAAAIYCLFLICLGLWLVTTTAFGPQRLYFGAPYYLTPLLEMPRLALLISVPVIASVPVAWIRGHWSQRLRWRLSWVALLMLAFVPFLRYWKLLGFQI